VGTSAAGRVVSVMFQGDMEKDAISLMNVTKLGSPVAKDEMIFMRDGTGPEGSMGSRPGMAFDPVCVKGARWLSLMKMRGCRRPKQFVTKKPLQGGKRRNSRNGFASDGSDSDDSADENMEDDVTKGSGVQTRALRIQTRRIRGAPTKPARRVPGTLHESMQEIWDGPKEMKELYAKKKYIEAGMYSNALKFGAAENNTTESGPGPSNPPPPVGAASVSKPSSPLGLDSASTAPANQSYTGNAYDLFKFKFPIFYGQMMLTGDDDFDLPYDVYKFLELRNNGYEVLKNQTLLFIV
jgi:hypothetical protein